MTGKGGAQAVTTRPAHAVIAALVLAGCSSSVLVRPDDAAFARARERLARSQASVDRTAAAADEKLRFLQAESFYRYRFAFPRRGLGANLATAAAVVVELPAFQTLAGSLDFIDLRLRSYDAATQLWESLLAERPTTPLRPLILYRLGWSYRSTSVSGLPRESGDEAFDLLIHDDPTSSLAELARTAKSVPSKSKATATGLSLVPGLGQMYVGEYLNGGVRLGIALAAVAMIVAPAVIAYGRRDDLSWGGDWPMLATGLAGLFVLNIDYTTAYQDALRGVVQFNERAEEAFERDHPDAP
jgi:hypothetical protein